MAAAAPTGASDEEGVVFIKGVCAANNNDDDEEEVEEEEGCKNSHNVSLLFDKDVDPTPFAVSSESTSRSAAAADDIDDS